MNIRNVLVIIAIALILSSCDSVVDTKITYMHVEEAPVYVKDWVLENQENGAYLAKTTIDREIKIYLYINGNNLKDSNMYGGYTSVNISPIKHEGLDINIKFQDDKEPSSKVFEIIIEKSIDYIQINDNIIKYEAITELRNE